MTSHELDLWRILMVEDGVAAMVVERWRRAKRADRCWQNVALLN